MVGGGLLLVAVSFPGAGCAFCCCAVGVSCVEWFFEFAFAGEAAEGLWFSDEDLLCFRGFQLRGQTTFLSLSWICFKVCYCV